MNEQEIQILLSNLETRIHKLENTFEGRLLHLNREMGKSIQTQIVEISKPNLSLIIKIKIFFLKLKQYILG